MNEQEIQLPEITDETVARIEQRVFGEIADEPSPRADATTRVQTRRRRWMTGLGIAAAFIVGMVIAPTMTGLGQLTAGTSEVRPQGDYAVSAPESAGSAEMDDADDAALDGGAVSDREIIASGSASLQADDVAATVSAIAALAESRGGFVEHTSVSAPRTSDEAESSNRGHGWITVRVPAAELAAMIDSLDEHGTVVSSQIGKEDVTMAAIDLRARVEALQASVDRLRALMSESGSLSDLIDAEVALTERQAELESYQQQLAALEDQVSLSSLDVEVISRSATVAADPAGFTDGLLAGWNGLVVTLNALVIAMGFMLPWLVLAGAVVLIIWLVRRRRRTRADDIER